MNLKNALIAIGIILVALGLLSIETENGPKNNGNNPAHPLDETVLNPEQSQPKVNDINIVAKTSEEAEIIASKFYTEVFSVVGIENGLMDDVAAGESINVANFYDQNEPFSQFVPLFANNKVVGVSIFRENINGQKELGSVSEIHEDWYSYPPVASYDAETELNIKYPMLNYKPVPGYFFIEDRSTPYYLYESTVEELIQYYLVNSYNKEIVVKTERHNQESYEKDLPVKFSEKGLIELDMDAMASAGLSDEEMQELKMEIAEINRHISDGTVKLDENMHIIYDRREKESVFSSGEVSDHNNINTDNDEKMDNTETPATVKE